jgi:hypothetical protein
MLLICASPLAVSALRTPGSASRWGGGGSGGCSSPAKASEFTGKMTVKKNIINTIKRDSIALLNITKFPP